MWTVPKAPEPSTLPSVISPTTGHAAAVTFAMLRIQLNDVHRLAVLLPSSLSFDGSSGVSFELPAAAVGQRTARTFAIHGSPLRR